MRCAQINIRNIFTRVDKLSRPEVQTLRGAVSKLGTARRRAGAAAAAEGAAAAAAAAADGVAADGVAAGEG
jgi:hypothetical protein